MATQNTEPAVKLTVSEVSQSSGYSHPYFRRNLKYTTALDTVGRFRAACFTVSDSQEVNA